VDERKKVLMLATTAAMIEQFNKNNILILEEMGYEVHVIGNWKVGNPISDERLEQFKVWLEEHHGKWFHMDSTRKPYDLRNNITAYKKVVKLIREHKYAFIHCHTPIGSVIGRVAAHNTKTKVIYTAHGFHFYDGAPFINWLLYYPVEKLLSYWTDTLILINSEDYNRAKQRFHASKIEYVPGVGIDCQQYVNNFFSPTSKRTELGFGEEDFLIISVGEINKNKNHKVVIKAIAKIANSKVKYIICGRGNERDKLIELAEENGIGDRVYFLGFRDDISELLHMADLFAFPSKREGLSLALMEAMACKCPVICSAIRGNIDLIDDEKGGYLVPTSYSIKLVEKINILANDVEKCKEMGMYNYNKVINFQIEKVMGEMKKIYENI